ncbi:endolysin [Vibrio phage 11895-B1]|uniref:endolysin n=1 Tax=Vibrio phage 11895-B1 TaxID=754075 RepID=UPI0002C1039D|nr:endolysin [Vibrio phage 11895-B1]AGH32168.1 hypothetical protein VPHG_00101 [Vibrio phage 11895-B1]
MTMVYFLSSDGKTKVGLDSESTVTVSMPSTVTKSSISSGKAVSHEVIEGNVTITVSGIVTYSKSKVQEDNLDPIELQEELQKARRLSRKFTLYMAEDGGLPLLQNYDNCVISNVNVTAATYSNAVAVDISFEQVFVSEAAKKAYLKPKRSSATAATTNSPSDTGQGTKTRAEEEDNRTMAVAVVEEVFDIRVGN